jgi:LPXTG-site transpeptidase (sortase) family protein
VLARRPAATIFAAGLMVIAAGGLGLLVTRHSTTGMRPPPIGVAALPAPNGPFVTPPPPPQAPQALPVARPVLLTIPLIGVRTRLINLGLAAGGAMQVPSTTTVAGWYTGSPRPGAIGSAIIVGHIDSLTGPGVFYRLSELRVGDRVYVRRADGTTVEFRVTSVQIYLKTYFPTADVFGAVPDAELRLITCGGTFDYATGHYLSNVIVFTTEVG